MKINDVISEGWSEKYKRSINCDRPKGFSQRAHCAGRKKKTESVIVEGGAMPGVGAIHISEIEPTLKKLQSALGIDLLNNTLGSVGKKEFSGDIDVAVDIDAKDIPELIKRLENTGLVDEIARSSIIMTRVRIVDYKPDLQPPAGERTGYVQVDFMMGDPSWMKTYYHAPYAKDSEYKGVFRNLLIAALAKNLNPVVSDERLEDGRPLSIERWMWSNKNGLVRIRRQPKPKARGDGYTKANVDEIIEGGYKDPDIVAEKLGLDSGEDLYSYETLRAAIEKNHVNQLVQRVLADFKKDPVVQDIGVPRDL